MQCNHAGAGASDGVEPFATRGRAVLYRRLISCYSARLLLLPTNYWPRFSPAACAALAKMRW